MPSSCWRCGLTPIVPDKGSTSRVHFQRSETLPLRSCRIRSEGRQFEISASPRRWGSRSNHRHAHSRYDWRTGGRWCHPRSRQQERRESVVTTVGPVRTHSDCTRLIRSGVGATGIFLLLIVCGCSTARQFSGIRVGEQATLITSLPPLLQTKRVSCGPTCLAAVAAYWEIDATAFYKTTTEFDLSTDFTAAELGRLGRELGLKPFIYQGSMEDLRDNLGKGRPLVVLIPKPEFSEGIELTFNRIPLEFIVGQFVRKQSHWIVVIGHASGTIIVHDPANGRIGINQKKFEEWWQSKRRTCLLLVRE